MTGRPLMRNGFAITLRQAWRAEGVPSIISRREAALLIQGHDEWRADDSPISLAMLARIAVAQGMREPVLPIPAGVTRGLKADR